MSEEKDPGPVEYGDQEAVALVYDRDGKLIRKIATRRISPSMWELAEPYTQREGEYLMVGMTGVPGASLHRLTK